MIASRPITSTPNHLHFFKSLIFLAAFNLLTTTLLPAQKRGNERIEKIKAISVIVGTWELKSTMIPLNAPKITESGTMHCTVMFDSTYLECQVKLTNQSGRKRAFKQFITYNPKSKQYEIVYLYSGSPMRIIEFGKLVNNELSTKTTFTQPDGKTEAIKTLLRLGDPNNLYFESRSSHTNNEVDYMCEYKRVK
jgi:Protein of unknown function (DUF1579)